jgi:putative Mn2+ efflux pump MntP
MTVPILLAGLLLGLDSLIVCFAIGLSPEIRGRRWLPLTFALCDGLGWWLGTSLGSLAWPAAEWVGPVVVAAYGLYVLAWARTTQRWAATGGSWLVFAVPIGLSLDNLVAGAAMSGPVSFPVIVAIGVISGVLALIGLTVGTALATRLDSRRGWLGGAALIVVAAFLTIKDAMS